MIIKIGKEIFDGNELPMAIQFSESEAKMVAEIYDNPLWRKKIMTSPEGYFKNDKEKERFIDDIPCDNNAYADGYLNLIGK